MRRLFGDQTLADYCEQHRVSLKKELREWRADDLLATSDQEIVEYLIDRYSISCPVLRREDGQSTEPENVDLPAYSPIPGIALGVGSRSLPGTKITTAIPYDGDQEVFYRRPNPFQFDSRSLDVEVCSGEVRIVWQQAERDAQDPDKINIFVETQLANLEFYLRQSARDVEMFNREISVLAASQVAARKARLLEERAVVAKLRYPVKRRSDSAQFQVPLTRRRLTPRPQPRSAGSSEQPEYHIGDADFEDAIKVLRHSRNGLERSPSLTADLDEEQIRFILLINLNAVFEGQAGGEVFNHKGKTDILIRVEDNNVFVGECKIWYGETKFQEAVDQLLSYLTWRDTKGTLLLFIRRQDVTAVIRKAVAVLERHPNYVKSLPVDEPGDRYDYVMHADGDPEKRVHLAFLPFALGPAASS